MIARARRVWQALIEPTGVEDARQLYLSRRLSIVLVLLFLWGLGVDIYYKLAEGKLGSRGDLILFMLLPLALGYYLNRRGYFVAAAIWMLLLFIISTFASAALQYFEEMNDLSALYYLAIPIVLAEMFLPFREFVLIDVIILGGVLALSMLQSTTELILAFLFVLSVLLAISGSNRRATERQTVALTGKFTQGQSLLLLEKRRSAQLGLLEQVGQQIANGLDEREIVERTVQSVVERLGYAEAAISLLIENNILEVAAIAGTQDYGYRPGYQQELGVGIIGYVGQTRATYVANDVQKDPYYFSSANYEGSAISVPILDDKALIGVLYIESSERNSFSADDVQMVQTLANQVAASVKRARLYAEEREHLRVVSTVQSVSHVLASSLDLEEIFKTVVRVLHETFGYSHASVYLLDGEFLHMGAQSGYDEERVYRKMHISQGVMGHTVRTKQAQFIRDVSADPHFLAAATDVGSEICVPLMKDNLVLGAINIEAKARHPLSQNDLDLLQLLAGPIALAVDNARLHAQVKAMAMTDAVTGLYNRHAFEDALNSEVERARRHSSALSLIIFDIDSFKEYNDVWGHPAGDERLKAIADLIRLDLRKYDVAARYGGDEFAIILPNTEKQGALKFARRLLGATQASTAEASVAGKGVAGYTLSIGTATYPQDAQSLATLLLAADQAALMAKRLGKSQVYSAALIDNP